MRQRHFRKRSAISPTARYLTGYTWDKVHGCFRNPYKRMIHQWDAELVETKLPPQMSKKQLEFTDAEKADIIRRLRIKWRNTARMFQKRIAKFRRNK